ncbi:hypothetical protein OVA10_23370 [Lelliottia sp. SL45]|uniref:FKBP-type peptidyl-prolyl cis-trans isomerase N-terminal domain-containing protein n=1 Tax=Lelliottia sp. SL45 TaxID=2994665 RepID=UPI002274D8D6|nr:FKBP-type peptidyl-prolyl cis-trans isomerase N-terminal domain-containing protein [Lelliottia sp. SL45]MCY1700955.1 hypothetical protein [Lelliottia sp. SL45]
MSMRAKNAFLLSALVIMNGETLARSSDDFLNSINEIKIPSENTPEPISLSESEKSRHTSVVPEIRPSHVQKKTKNENYSPKKRTSGKLTKSRSVKKQSSPGSSSVEQVKAQPESIKIAPSAQQASPTLKAGDSASALNKKINDLTRRNEVLEAELSKRLALQEDAMKAAKGHDSAMPDQKQNSNSVKSILNERITTLSRELESVTAKKNAELANFKLNFDTKIASLMQDKVQAEKSVNALNEKITVLTRRNSELESAMSKGIAGQEESKKLLDAKMASLMQDKAQAEKSVNALNEKITVLTRRNSELESAMSKGIAGQEESKKLLDAKMASLMQDKAQAEKSVNALNEKITVLTRRNSELESAMSKGIAGQEESKKLLDAKMASLMQDKAQAEKSVNALNEKITVLTRRNSELESAMSKGIAGQEESKKLLDAKMASLMQDKAQAEKSVNALNEKITVLTRRNSELESAMSKGIAGQEESKKLLDAKMASLMQDKAQAEKSVNALNEKITVLTRRNSELESAMSKGIAGQEESKKLLDAKMASLMQDKVQAEKSVAELNEKVKLLTKKAEPLAADSGTAKVKLATPEDKYAYSLGVAFFRNIQQEITHYKSNHISIDIKTIMAGIHDAQRGNTALKNREIENTINEFNSKIEKGVKSALSRIKKEIAAKKSTKLQGSLYLVVSRQGREKYGKDERITFDVRESLLDGKILMNSLNNHVMSQDEMPEFITVAITKALKGGEAVIYGLAADFYSPSGIPKGLDATTPVKFTITLR